MFETYLGHKKKAKKCDTSEQLNRIKEHIAEIGKNTLKLKDSSNIMDVLTKFKLPVSISFLFKSQFKLES